jgi:hypothetical protein
MALKSARLPLTALAMPMAFALVYLQVFILPITPVAAWGDQSLFLVEARHLLEGLNPYSDVFEFNTPGTHAIYWGSSNCSASALGFRISCWFCWTSAWQDSP